jgi:hypothetical protein
MPPNEVDELGFSAIVMLADSVAAPDGKLYIQGGGWDNLMPPIYPARIPRLGVAIQISVPFGQTNRNHQLRVRLTDDDGENMQIGMQPENPHDPFNGAMKPVTTIEATVNVGRPPFLQNGDSQVFPMALNLDGVTLNQPGAYTVLVEVDDHEIGRARFRAQPAQPTIAFGR